MICKRSTTRSYHPGFGFCHALPQALAQFDAKKRNVLLINGMGYTKENHDFYQFGLQDWPFQ